MSEAGKRRSCGSGTCSQPTGQGVGRAGEAAAGTENTRSTTHPQEGSEGMHKRNEYMDKRSGRRNRLSWDHKKKKRGKKRKTLAKCLEKSHIIPLK